MPPKSFKAAAGSLYKPSKTTVKPTGTQAKKAVKKTSTGVKKKGKGKKLLQPVYQRLTGLVENFIVVWLDGNINAANKDCQYSITQLRRLVNSIKTFTDRNDCIVFLNQIKDEKIFLIVSGFFGAQVVPIVEHLPQLASIYVFCSDKAKHQSWANKHLKIKDVFVKIDPLCEVLKDDIRQCDTDIVSISIVSPSMYNLDVLDPSFMYSKLLKEILLEIEHGEQAIVDLVSFCGPHYEGNAKELRVIDEFRKTYAAPAAIWWYTRECFTYTMVNRALRTHDIEIIIKMGFFIRDLHQQIEQLHTKMNHRTILTVYRGQALSTTEFERLRGSLGSLLSFNSFLSTSLNRQTALQFARNSRKDSSVTPIFFQMEIDPSLSSTPFAAISEKSYVSTEEEILFSMHTVFRIEEVKAIKEGIWKVLLKLTQDDDQQLQCLTDHMRLETSGLTGWDRLGALMIAMGQYGKAEEFYTSELSKTVSERDWKVQAHIYCQLGRVYDEKEDYKNALDHYEEALDMQLENLPPDDPSLAMTYVGIGSALHAQEDSDSALEHFQHALNIASRSTNADDLKIATIYNYIGQVYDEQAEYVKALNSYQQALAIRQRYLPPLHPLLATTYNNIGLLHQSMNDYSKALTYLEETLNIERKSLPGNHPSLAITHHNTSEVLERLYRYQEAVDHQTHAVEISKVAYGSNHPKVQKEENDLRRLLGKL